MSITSTSLTHNNVQCRIAASMLRTSKLNWKWCHVFNKKGNPFLTCCYIEGVLAWALLGYSSGFLWLDRNGNNVSETVNNSLSTKI